MTSRQLRLWTGALTLSVLLHVSAAAILSQREKAVKVAGGAPVGIALLGSAFEDASATGAAAETPSLTESVATPTALVAEAATAVAAAPVLPTAARGTIALPARSRPARPENTPVVAPDAAPTQEAAVAAKVEPAETVLPPEDVPVPTPRPDLEAIQAERRSTPPAPRLTDARETPRRQSEPPRSGARGRDAANARRGSASGQNAKHAEADGHRTSRASAAGNAAVSNYPGQVVSKLRRALRYPPRARRRHLTGEVRVTFAVSRDGSASAIRIVRGSGHAVLDEAALQAVRRAAPFPAIPQGANRSNWTFTVPLAFIRQ